jgi:glycosyltransferase involved in cell wall biosynthesis
LHVNSKAFLRPAVRRLRSARSAATALVADERDRLRTRRGHADLAVFHEFRPPPWGGGNQFLMALVGELRARGLRVETNQISGETPVCLFNSFNFEFPRLRRFRRADVRFVHRVDGPIGAYRGHDDGTDRRIERINQELADATVFQSRYSLEKHRELGYELRNPVVIRNAPDPRIFHPPADPAPADPERLRIIASSWSDNPRKGADVLAWMDANLDPNRYRLTFVGRTQVELARATTVAPLPSERLAELLRRHDVYLAASIDDPCSNGLLEALACGLPALYRRSGGHSELVGAAGVGFRRPEEIPAALEGLAADHAAFRAAIRVVPLPEVADRYLEVLRCERA